MDRIFIETGALSTTDNQVVSKKAGEMSSINDNVGCIWNPKLLSLMRIVIFLFFVSFTSCTFFNSQDKKMFIKSVQSNDITADWYIYSLISSFSPAKIQIEKEGKTYQIIEFGHYVTDITLTNNILTVQTSKTPDFDVDEDVLKEVGLQLHIDTTGSEWNESTTRFGRLQRKEVDFFKRHFEDTYGTNFGD